MSTIKFPGYEYKSGVSTYKGEEVGEGGYVYAEPGVHTNVALLDVASMHPASIEALELFGPYTKNFSDIKEARMAIKHGDLAKARKLLGGRLAPYLKDDTDAESLSYALKIVINSVYGLTAATFPNRFMDPRNKDNIVAKRGALFMVDLKHFVQEQGFNVAHIKTDSIKIPDATPEIIQLVFEFGKRYGYDFEHEATYDVLTLVNDAVYICHDDEGWHATGAMFKHPYVFKTLFSGEEVTMEDLHEARSVQKGHIYTDPVERDESLKDASTEIPLEQLHFVGRTGVFVPVKEGRHGGPLWRVHEGRYHAVTGTKGYYWREARLVDDVEDIDMNYYQELVDKAMEAINKVGSYEDTMAVIG